ncbi:MAG: hypothetical protein L6R43_01000 [Planctomycetes bacterium]|nr:hypothetical protein [Planctomycetota bacterium]
MGEAEKAAPAAPLPRGLRWPWRSWRDLPLPVPDSNPPLSFDLLLGAAVPALLLHLDLHWLPTIAGGLLGDASGVLPFRPYTPILAFACIAALLAWLPFRRRGGWAHAVAAGPLLLGALFAGGTAVVLLPASLMGALVLGIGLLGLLPFLTAAVFAGAGLRALAHGRDRLGAGPALAMALLAACVLGGGCLAAGRLVRIAEFRATEVIAGERRGDPAAAERRLRLLHSFPGVDLRALLWKAREMGDDGDRRITPAGDAWRRITGLDFVEEWD